ncbi:cytoplasmic tRNA 2-thiolation protein 2 [Ostrinia nubilalis]|uniref:cytoplasmic tRNA 2-thiolation protein 2 n=1 Tax=Ostrinia nubilalis TaxID=29057 RepID=UPI0030826888
MSNCKKCGLPGSIILRKKDLYCTECFQININHKFRACIGKNKILNGNENVLICLSGGPCSTVLMDLIHNGITLNNHKKLSIRPIFFHLMGLSEKTDAVLLTKALIEKCNHYKFNIYVGHIAQYLLKDIDLPEVNVVPEVNNNLSVQFNDLVHSMSVSSKIDFVSKASRDLYINFAKLLQCRYVFTGETLGTLATNLLTNLTIGRGSQVQHDVGFCDNRSQIKILRPIKDISQEEIDQYIKINQLDIALTSSPINQENCLQTVIKNFVIDLQENYQATVSTVCKTADKIGIGTKKCNTCEICESDVGEISNKLSALEATNFSSTISAGQDHMTLENNLSIKATVYSMFPHVNQTLCYTCSKMFSEIDLNIMPERLKEVL